MVEILELLKKQDDRLKNIEDHLSVSNTILNIDEVVRLTSLSKSTIYKLTCGGGIPHYKQSKHLYFDRSEVESWLKSNRVKTKEEIEREAISYTIKKGGVK